MASRYYICAISYFHLFKFTALELFVILDLVVR